MDCEKSSFLAYLLDYGLHFHILCRFGLDAIRSWYRQFFSHRSSKFWEERVQKKLFCWVAILLYMLVDYTSYLRNLLVKAVAPIYFTHFFDKLNIYFSWCFFMFYEPITFIICSMLPSIMIVYDASIG